MISVNSADVIWLNRITSLLSDGPHIYTTRPRGLLVREELHVRHQVNLTDALLKVPARRLNYRFAAAEALWIMTGSNRVDELTPYNKRMAQFSDDGVTLAGAYGPRLYSQLEYVLSRLEEDRDTRQAVASIWTPNPQRSKDIPCTLALTFMIRDSRLNVHAFMRSSDVWLGLPYDLFSFACYGLMVMHMYNEHDCRPPIYPGQLFLTAASSHLYEQHHEPARQLLKLSMDDLLRPEVHCSALNADDLDELTRCLIMQRDTGTYS